MQVNQEQIQQGMVTLIDKFSSDSTLFLTTDDHLLTTGSRVVAKVVGLHAFLSTQESIRNGKCTIFITKPVISKYPDILKLANVPNNQLNNTDTQNLRQARPQTASWDGLASYLEKYDSLDISPTTGEVKTLTKIKVSDIPQHYLNDLLKNDSPTLTVNNQTYSITRRNDSLLISKQGENFNSIKDLIDYGIQIGASNITIDSSNGYYKLRGEVTPFNKAFNSQICESLISAYNTQIKSILTNSNVYTETLIINDTTVNLKIVSANTLIIIIDFVMKSNNALTDYYDKQWVTALRDFTRHEQGTITIITEKLTSPEIIPLLLDEVVGLNDTTVIYNKDIPFNKGVTLKFPKSIPINQLVSVCTHVVVFDIMDANEDWDSVFDIVEQGTSVILTTTETTLATALDLTLSLLTETYRKRKLIQCLFGINTVRTHYDIKTNSFTVENNYVYNNCHFNDLLAVELYDTAELSKDKYKQLYFQLTDSQKSAKEELQALLQYLVDHKAHDMSLCAGSQPRFRVGEDLVCGYTEKKLTPSILETFYRELVPVQKQREEFQRDPSEGISVSYSLSGVGRFRISIYKQCNSISISARLINSRVLSVEECGIPKQFMDTISNVRQGLILVTGKVGTGKSTTVATILDHFNSTRVGKILSIEDPIEYLHRHKKSLFEQMEIGSDTMSYDKSLARMLRNDVDILCVAEIRTPEALQAVMRQALSGCLVIATFHTSNSISTINKLIDMTPLEARESIKSTLAEVLVATYTQQLVPCTKGGRVPAVEVLYNSPSVATLICSQEPNAIGKLNNYLLNKEFGNIHMDRHLADLVISKMITRENGLLYSQDKAYFEKLIAKVPLT